MEVFVASEVNPRTVISPLTRPGRKCFTRMSSATILLSSESTKV